MKNFAKLDDQNFVINVVAVDDEACAVDESVEGEIYCQNLFGGGNWKQSSLDGSFRKRMAGKLGYYDPTNNVFIDQKPYASWSLDSNFDWQAPVTYPNSTMYGAEEVTAINWDEPNLGWIGMARTSEEPLVWNKDTLAWGAA